ncbi:hypothetical protein AB0M12_35935 [Nocardia vinacea]|uniref:MmyB family transcriptional regulator n=1 Tax=Nocardia vinacea TaxID=96468 RepID=UPI003425AFE7
MFSSVSNAVQRPRRAQLEELSRLNAQFRHWWADHHFATRDTGTKHLCHPIVGDLHLDWNAVTWAADPDLQIIVWSAEPGTPTHDALRLLGRRSESRCNQRPRLKR